MTIPFYGLSKFHQFHFPFRRTLLTDTEKAQINEACDMAIDLNNFKLKIYEYVESRMTFIAPNLSMIIGKFAHIKAPT